MEPNLGVSEILGQHTDNPEDPRSGENFVVSIGQTWEVPPLEQGIKGQFEQWMRKNIIQGIAECEADGMIAEAAAMRTAFLTARAAGNYNWQGSAWRASVTDIPGSRYLFYLLLRRCHKEMTLELTHKIFKGNPKGSTDAINWALGNEVAPQVGANRNGQPAMV